MLVKPIVRSIVRHIAGNPVRASGSGFSPVSLFSDGSKGVVYDNNDLSSFYLDSGFVTPATVNGLVGGQLDKSGNGFHRTQATTGSKPVLRGTPTGANLVTNGDFATDTVWTKGSGWTIGSGVATYVGPAGASSTLSQTVAITTGKVYRVTYTVTAITTGPVYIRIEGAGTVNGTFRTATGTYVEYLTATETGSIQVGLRVNTGSAGISVDNFEIVDVSAGSVTAPYGLQYDGVDDFMQTAAVDFTATDKMFVCAGVRKLSDAATALILELGANSSVASSSFGFQGPSVSGSNKFNFNTGGTIVVVPAATTTTYNAPYLGVLTGVGNIAGDSAILRINGVEIQNLALDQGTGNYANAVLYFGRRGGTSIPYNGLEYGLVICGKTLTSTQITQTERYVAQRTGVTL